MSSSCTLTVAPTQPACSQYTYVYICGGAGWGIGRISNGLFLQMYSESALLRDFSEMLQAFGLRFVVIYIYRRCGGLSNAIQSWWTRLMDTGLHYLPPLP